MILILGDSNYRNTMEVYGNSLSLAVEDVVNFEFCSSVESLKLALSSREDSPTIIMIASPLNEIATRITKNQAKGRDATVKAVIEEQIKAVTVSAKANPSCLYVCMPPFLRQDPKWMEEKVTLAFFYTKEGAFKAKMSNLALGSIVDITTDDLVDDKVHLNDTGKEKLNGIIEADIMKCKEALAHAEDGEPYTQDWASQLTNENEPPTPLSIRKRQRSIANMSIESEAEGETEVKKAKTGEERIIDKLELVLKKLDEHKDETKANFRKMDQKLEQNKNDVVQAKKKVEKIEKRLDKNDLHTAEMKEDIDGLENENLRSVVVVRKLATKEVVPMDKKSLSSFVLKAAKDLVKEILNEEAVKTIKYVTTLYAFIDPTKKDNAKGLVPPFKIGFITKDQGICFRETAVKKAKEENNKFASTYFTHCQSSATRIRCTLMWGVADGIKSDTKEVWVNQHANKPTLQVKEAGKVKTYSFAKAMEDFKEKIPKKTLDEATKIAKRYFAGHIKKTFIVLSD